MLLCDEEGCGAVQHAACSMQSDSEARWWRCDDCWLAAGERPVEEARGVRAGSDRQDGCQIEGAKAKRNRMSAVDRLGWVAGVRVLDARGVEHVIQAMRHGYVQCSRPGYPGLRNYRRKELQLVVEASDAEGSGSSGSSTSESDREDLLEDEVSDREGSWEDAEEAGEEP